MTRPGAFVGVVASGAWDGPPSFRHYIAPESCLPLPPALPVHAGHRLLSTPVAVATPWFVDDYFADGRSAVIVHAVFASHERARTAFSRIQEGYLALSGIWTGLEWEECDGKYHATSGVLIAADLVTSPVDKRAQIRSVTAFEQLTDAQREVQQRFDEYLADDSQPLGVDFLDSARRMGRDALEPLWDVVLPIRCEYLTSGRAA